MSLSPGFNLPEAMNALRFSYVVDCYETIAAINAPAANDPLGTPSNPAAPDYTGNWPGSGNPPVQLPMEQSTQQALRPIFPGGWQPIVSTSTPWIDTCARSDTDSASQTTKNVAMVLQSTSSPTTYLIAFRGTSNVANVRQDAVAIMVTAFGIKFRYAPLTYPGAMVHMGFRDSLETMVSGSCSSVYGLDDLINMIPNPQNCDIIVTGHSLGAGQATLCAGALKVGGFSGVKAKFNSIKMYALAQPYPGNAAYQSAYVDMFGTNSMAFCIDNTRDPIPTLPLDTGLPYVPIGTQIKLTGTAVTFTPSGTGALMPSSPYAYYTPSSGPQPTLLQSPLFRFIASDTDRLAIIEDLWQHWPFVYASMLSRYTGS